MSSNGGGDFDYDTYVNPKTYEMCVIAQSAWIDAFNTLRETGKPAFALTRPPGHHACPDRAMGFCIFNFAAVTAKHAIDEGLRVAILDWDVHHGEDPPQDLPAINIFGFIS